MLTTITKRLPSLVAAQLRTPSTYPTISLVARRVADQIRSKSSTAPMTHDGSCVYDSFYHHSYDDVLDVEHDLEVLAEKNANRLAHQRAGLLSPCGTISLQKFSLEGPAITHDMEEYPNDAKAIARHREEKASPQPPHSDLTHLEDPYHQYEYHPATSDLPNIAGIRNYEDDVVISRSAPPRFNIVQDDAKGTTIEVDVTNYHHQDVSAQIENGTLLHIHGKTSFWAGHDNAEEMTSFDQKFAVGPHIDQDGVTAKLKDGILTIHVPKVVKEINEVKNIPIA